MSTEISSIRNLGPAMQEACIAAGIPDAETLREMGADAAYARLLSCGTRPHFIGYYVLHMALQGRPWNDCKGKEKEALRVAFDALRAQAKRQPQTNDSALEQALNDIGVVPKAFLSKE